MAVWLVMAWMVQPHAFAKPSSAAAALRNGPTAELQQYAAPAEQVLPDLKAGLKKLQRLCALPSSREGGQDGGLMEALDLLKAQWATARQKISGLQQQAETTLTGFERQSRVGQMPWCKVSPGWLKVCDGFRSDQELLANAREVSDRLFSEALQRLEVYEQYAVLEANRCTSRGFTRRLWLTEETYLLPLVNGAPALLQRVLRAP